MLARASAHDMLVRPPGRWAGDPQHAYRAVQDARKAAGLDVSDRIGLTLTVPDDHVADVRKHREFVAAETLAVSLDVVPGATLAVEVVEA
ncbi:MAG: DUF5915 domain-containing protein [Micrococcales bacterium]|nr:DUF5915 domain-containing protein [Micrococcales bacterium]